MKKGSRWQFLLAKVKLSARALLWLFSHLRYAAAAALAALFFFEFVYWMLKFSVFWTLMTSPNLTILDKLHQLTGLFTYLTAQNGYLIAGLMVLLAAIQGASLTAVVYAVRHQPKLDETLLGESAVIGFIALVGLGCPACGTSLITPIVALFVSGSAVAVSQVIARILLPLAVLVGLYGLYVVGLRVASIRAHQGNAHLRTNPLISRLKKSKNDT